MIPPAIAGVFPGKLELGHGLDGVSLLELETKLFLVLNPRIRSKSCH